MDAVNIATLRLRFERRVLVKCRSCYCDTVCIIGVKEKGMCQVVVPSFNTSFVTGMAQSSVRISKSNWNCFLFYNEIDKC